MFTAALLLGALLIQEPQTPPATAATSLPPIEVTAPTEEAREEDDARLVCEYRSTVGSNRRQRICMTAAQRRAMAEESRQYRDRMNQPLLERSDTHEGFLGGGGPL